MKGVKKESTEVKIHLELSTEEAYWLKQVMFNIVTKPLQIVRQVHHNDKPFTKFHDELQSIMLKGVLE